MLTSDDLQNIRSIVREEVENEVEALKDDVGYDMKSANLRLRESIDDLKNRIKNLEIRVRKMNNENIDEEEVF